jgi:hypothetical protein
VKHHLPDPIFNDHVTDTGEGRTKSPVMRIATILLLIFLASCSKNQQLVSKVEKLSDKEPVSCNFGMNVFNTTKRPAVDDHSAISISPKKHQPVEHASSTILLVFGGDVVTNTLWNTNGAINCAPSNLHPAEIEKVLERVTEDFSPFNVAVTTDAGLYNATHPQKRIKIIITESWEWFGVAGGIAYHNSFLWGNNTPAFVFSTLLHYNEKFIAEAISHELGHTFGLQHQGNFNNNCSFLAEYHSGDGGGLTGWAPIMGNSYYKNVTTWHKGPSTECGSIQDEVNILAGLLGKRADEDGKINQSPVLVSSMQGVINHADDEDFYIVDLKQPGQVIVTPNCIGDGIGANLHLKINVYGTNGRLVSSHSNPASLMASVDLSRGRYRIGIETIANDYQTRYGMLGRYEVKLLN